ncbi:bcl-2-binding component 3 [Hippocampus zosterae]|uniref:bcl-2-binding component 3 n=1 Tax=Hippocampus zosterae TaxID=109293 RepID=UPI00223D0D1D|nr:bcl-2-binding component 3 [Hippocampus zosterae]
MARAETVESVGEAAGENQQQNHQEQPILPTPLPLPPDQPNAFLGEQSERRQRQEVAHQRSPLPDLLPQDQRAFGGGSHLRSEVTMEAGHVDTHALAQQLRTIGDQFNASVLRAHDAPHWQDWIDVRQGFLNLVARTLSALYRLA